MTEQPTASGAQASGPQVSSARLVATLAIAGTVAGLLLVVVFHLTRPAIEAHRARVLRDAVHEVLHAPDRYEPLALRGDELVSTPSGNGAVPAGVYVGYRGDRRVGYAIVGAGPGFQDVVRLIFGYDAATGTLLGMKVLESKETPGLGDRIETDAAFVARFAGARPALVGVKQGRAGDDRGKVDMITGATISSRAVIRIINERLARLRPALDAYEEVNR